MRPEKEARIEAVIARLEAEGVSVTNNAVHAVVRGSRRHVVSFLKQWRAERHTNGAVGVMEPSSPGDDDRQAVPAPDQAPLLVLLAREHTAVQRDRDAVHRREEEVAVALHTALWQAKTALVRLRHASRMAREAPLHAVRDAVEEQERCRHALARYVGDTEAARAAHNPQYVPRGL